MHQTTAVTFVTNQRTTEANVWVSNCAATVLTESSLVNNLVRLLLVITNRKVSRRHRHDRQQRRDVRRTSTELPSTPKTNDLPVDVCDLESREPSPEFGATFSDTCDQFIDRLGDPKLIEVALLRIEGYTDGEIAERLNCVRSTVQRRLSIVRRECEALAEAND